MERCLELAKKGLGYTDPNPFGLCHVHKGKVIAEGAKKAVVTTPKGSYFKVKDTSHCPQHPYVNLGPCDHYGKTPPAGSDLK